MPLLEKSDADADGHELIGRDPRVLTPADFAEDGVALSPPLKAIRAKCVDCSGGSLVEVRKCVATTCPLWALRMGVFPKRLRVALRDAGEDNVEGLPPIGGEP